MKYIVCFLYIENISVIFSSKLRRKNMATIYPSLISADPVNLEHTIKLLDPHVQGYHIDVMDNHFVPNLTWGSDTVNAIAQATIHPLWVHLMVTNPEDWIGELDLMGGSMVTFHHESPGAGAHLIQHIKEKNWYVSIAINPDTPVEKIFNLLPLVDQVLIMSVQPGFAGQPFMTDVIKKIEPLMGYRASSKLPFRIAMDGGITIHNIAELAQKGVEDFAIASAIFGYPDPVEAIKILQERASR
jgi:ribulose-phosphate 3-epimerase